MRHNKAMRPPHHSWRWLGLAGLVVGVAHADPVLTITAAPAVSTTTAAIPLPEIPLREASLNASLRDLKTDFSSDPVARTVDQELPTLDREISARHQESSRILGTAPSLDLLRTMVREWQKLHHTLADWSHDLDRRQKQLDDQIQRLTLLQDTWQQTLHLAESSTPDAPVIAHIHTVLNAIGQTKQTAESQRTQVADLQTRVADVDSRAVQALASVQQAREKALGRILTRDSLPIWDATIRAPTSQSIVQEGQTSFSAQIDALHAYVKRRPEQFLIHVAVIIVFLALVILIRRNIGPWAQEEPEVGRALRILNAPMATALLLSFFPAEHIYPEAPRLLRALLGTAAIFPAIFILRQLLERHLFSVLNALMLFYFVDRVRMVVAALPLVSRSLFLVEILGGALFMAWLLRPARLEAVPPADRDRIWATIAVWAKTALVFFGVAFVANVFGYQGLSSLLGNAVLRSAYLAVVLYASLQVLALLTLFTLRIPPLNRFAMVRNHRAEMGHGVRWVLERLALLAWALATLEMLAMRLPLFHATRRILGATLTIGAISISFGNLIEFGLAIWVAALVSRFVRFALDEEVYPRLELRRGLPYAISTVLHYAILFVGLVMAMGALGLDMTKFTILVGAFGVGIGFGMQTIINNFFSGLILLFERPVKVGDVIQIDDATGVVEKIGIRACTLRTMSGAEIIIPNGSLIAGKVINWTFSSSQRMIEMPVSVAPGADAKKVIAILEETAKANPHITKTPPPRALVVKMGAASLDLEIHASTNRIEDWNQVRSDLAIAMKSALAAAGVDIR